MKHLAKIEQEFWSKRSPTCKLPSPNLVPVFRVGELFQSGRTNWPQGGQFTYSPGGLELTLFRTSMSAEVVNAVRQGEVELALITELPLIVLAYRFGDAISWDDVPYSWHLQPASWRVVPSRGHSPDTRVLLWITLVDVSSGLICAQRGVTLSPNFTRTLHEAIHDQALLPFDADECTSAVSRVFLQYPTTADRLRLANVRTLGNE
jgi:hypothetical protein